MRKPIEWPFTVNIFALLDLDQSYDQPATLICVCLGVSQKRSFLTAHQFVYLCCVVCPVAVLLFLV